MPTRLLILDTSSIFFRAFHAMPSLTSAAGEPAGAIYGFLSLLFKAVEQVKPTHIAAALDVPGPTLRDEILPTYKANRPEVAPELISQIVHIPEVLRALGIPSYAAPAFEADDVIGSITAQMSVQTPAAKVIILSGDLDTLQLVSDNVSAVVPKKGISETTRYTPKEVQDRFGIGPELLPSFKALRGDPSDNIPGVSGIGEKGATLLLKHAGSLDGVTRMLCKEADAPKELLRYAKNFCAAENELPRLLDLVTIRRDVPISFVLSNAEFRGFERPDAQQMLTRFGFRSLAARAQSAFKKTASEHRSLEEFIGEQEKTVLDEIKRAEQADIFSKEIAELERSLVPVVSLMERRGISVDSAALSGLGQEFRKETRALEQKIFEAAGQKFNLASPLQLREILFVKLGLASSKRTGKGKASTAAAALDALRGQHPAIDDILRWRELNKLITTYADALPKLVDPADGYIHAKFWQLGTATGRIASSDPNLQNIPARTREGQAIRRAFRARTNRRLLSCDYSQMELRIAAVLSQDKNLLSVFSSGGDVHTATAARVFHVEEQAVDSLLRARAKTVNFAMLYGAGPRRVAEELGTGSDEAQALIDEYFAAFPSLASWIRRTKQQAQRDGFVATPSGRRRFLPDIVSQDQRLRAQAERMAVNTPIQGGAADLVKKAMVQYAAQVPEATLLVQVHDELLFEIDENKTKDAAANLRSLLEGIWPNAGVAFPVKCSLGTHWGEWEQVI